MRVNWRANAARAAPSIRSSCGIAVSTTTLVCFCSSSGCSRSLGLLLNHPRWQFAQFWPNRIQNTTEHTLESVTGATEFDRALDVMRQLGITGEISGRPYSL